MLNSRHVVLARRPDGPPVPADFDVRTRTLPALPDGRALVQVLYATANPGSRNRLSGHASYARAMEMGETMEGPAVGRVVQSRNPDFQAGDMVAGPFGWAEHVQVSGRGLRRLPSDTPSVSAWAGILSIPGLTGYFGIRDVGAAQASETVLISSAAGPVGATAGQIARIMGCRVIGIASGDAKLRWLRDVAGFDAVVDRSAAGSADALAARIAAVAPDGVDIYFDNVGGPLLDAAIANLRPKGRIVVSGQISDYNTLPEARYGTRRVHDFIGKRLRMEGLVVFDFADRFDEATTAMTAWIRGGKLAFKEHIEEGLEALPGLFCAQLRGEIFGRALARLAS
ncbi:NADP-dependent oxidoreductase [Reyranella sp. CPCC 100927]|uniref:NADP-dependent oxidoreductase n=1 Tax=Reyranella sp. CPCC 100927 TaxID=2599616 RepID=UPI0011B67A7B|nr:NADP-dependent oxidoreductase [Reyranella sp. CPCC 100927]TWT10802.1 NADP-dependent oxidoreductase [Reyranella sp. CPCC 100927]